MSTNEELTFEGRVAVVTGAGRGLGKEYALLLASRGARVVVNDSGASREGEGWSAEPAAEVTAAIEAAGGVALADTSDISVRCEADAMVAAVIEQWGRIDIVVNNAGIAIFKEFQALSDQECRRTIEVDFLGTFNVLRAVWPHMIAAGYGRVVNSCSDAFLGDVGTSLYGACKGAVLGLTKSLAMEGAQYGILVNAVLPVAFTRLADIALDDPGTRDFIAATFPSWKAAPAVVALAHEKSTWTGEVFQTGAGRVGRMSFAVTPGMVDPLPTPEAVLDRAAEIFDAPGSATPNNLGDSLGFAIGQVTAGATTQLELKLDSTSPFGQ